MAAEGACYGLAYMSLKYDVGLCIRVYMRLLFHPAAQGLLEPFALEIHVTPALDTHAFPFGHVEMVRCSAFALRQILPQKTHRPL